MPKRSSIRKNADAPTPVKGQNYHQWMSAQFGLKRLIEHIWMLIGMARGCHTMRELQERMAQMHGRLPIQFNMFLPAPSKLPGRKPPESASE